MVRYRRNFIPGGNLLFHRHTGGRRSSLLSEQIAALRHAFRTTRIERPFRVDAIVVLPDHCDYDFARERSRFFRALAEN